MKICFIVPSVIATVSGGMLTQVTLAIKSLRNLGVEVEVFNPWMKYDWDAFDLVHIFRADNDTYNMAQWLYESNIPFVVSPVFYNSRSHFQLGLSSLLSRIIQHVFRGMKTDLDSLRTICEYSTRVLPNTESEAIFISDGIGIEKNKISVIPNIIEERFSDANSFLFEKQFGLSNFILAVGNFGYQRKNMLNLLYALEKIDHHAVLIGKIYDNDYGKKCHKKIKSLKNITWIDAIDHNDPLLESAYATCKVFAMPSLFETPGLAAMEAALAGANIVITPHGGPKEYFLNMAYYVDPKNIESIRNGIEIALKSKTNPELKKHILNNYTITAFAKNVIPEYQLVVKSRKL